MSEVTPAELQRLIASAFDRQGWDYDLTVGRTLTHEIERAGGVDAAKLAQQLPAGFIERNRTSRANVAAAIEQAVGDRVIKHGQSATTLVFSDNRRYEVRLGRGAQIYNSNLNLGDGTQVDVSVEATKNDVLAAVEMLLRAALIGDWNDDAVGQLASVIEQRSDIDFEDVRALTLDVIQAEHPRQGRVKALLSKLAVSGIGGALGTGLSAGMGELLTQLPI